MSMEKWTRMNCGVGYGRHGSVPLRSHSGELPAQNTVSWEPPPASPWVPRLHFSWGCFYLMDGAHWGVHAGPFPLVQDFPHGQPWLETSYQIMPTLRTSWWSGILPIQVFLSSLWSQVSDLNLRLRFPLPLSVPSPFIFHRPFFLITSLILLSYLEVCFSEGLNWQSVAATEKQTLLCIGNGPFPYTWRKEPLLLTSFSGSV